MNINVSVFQVEFDIITQNKQLIDAVVKHSMIVPDSYSKFIEALMKSDQESLASLLTSVDKELEIVGQCESVK